MSDISMQQKWDRHYKDANVGAASRVLMENSHLLPSTGVGLEIACGMGANALFLAERGLTTHAWDISPVAIQGLQHQADTRRLPLIAEVRDSIQDPPVSESFDVISVSHFLDRTLLPALIDALKLGGLLFYQTFTRARVDDSGPRNDDYRLGDNELLTLCCELRLLVYREEGVVGDHRNGFRNLAMLVGQKK